jgi:hypothetical protein
MDDRQMLITVRDEIDAHIAAHPHPVCGDIELKFCAADPRDVPKGHFEGWVWPMPIYGDKPPAISNGFDPDDGHNGVDIMYRNDRQMPPDPPERSAWYHCPSNIIPMYAAGPGHLWKCELLSNGWAVRIDHHDWFGFPLNSLYLHMQQVFVPEWNGAGGMYLPAGYPIGIVGDGSAGTKSTNLNHCHFELLDYSSSPRTPLNPAPYLDVFGWGVVPA